MADTTHRARAPGHLTRAPSTPAAAAGAKLDPREEHSRVPSPHRGLSLFLRYLPPDANAATRRGPVLYVHGGTFPSGVSIAHRFDGGSWRDELCALGFH